MRLTAKISDSQNNRGFSDWISMSSMRFAITVAAVSFVSHLCGLLPGTLHSARADFEDSATVLSMSPEEAATTGSRPDAGTVKIRPNSQGQFTFTAATVDDAGSSATGAPQSTESEDAEQQAFKPVLPDPVAQSPFKEPHESRVKVRIYPYFDKLQRGGKCPVAIELTIADGWHINANPANSEFAIPTEVKITSKQKIKMTKIKYPHHELLEVDGQDAPSHVYGGRVIIYAMLEISADESADEAELEVEVKIQACNEKTCEPPETKKLIGKRPLANPGDEIKRIHESKFPKDDDREKSQEKQVKENSSAP